MLGSIGVFSFDIILFAPVDKLFNYELCICVKLCVELDFWPNLTVFDLLL